MGHVIPVSDENESEAFEGSEVFPEREHIRECLARMERIAQGVYHRDTGPKRQIFNRFLLERPSYDAISPASKISGDILQRLAFADHSRLGHGIASQLLHGKFERQPSAQGWLLKQERSVLVLE